jgi:hypothetical protein
MRISQLTVLSALLLSVFANQTADAQHRTYWQQQADYKMEIDFDVQTNRFEGHQVITYTNNSPDELTQVFYHLYFNAFQPNSMMDKRSRTISDPDGRVRDRIYHYDETEIGYQKIHTLTQNGQPTSFEVKGTILQVQLAEPIQPGVTVELEMTFEAQVPLQTRRSGRDNAEGIRYSMAQWYPKLSEYDYKGWHTNPYIGREFHGVFGTFDVTIHIDRNYVVAGGGIVQNPQEVGYGYENPDRPVNRPDGEKLTWKFLAENVHDFMWAADPDYTHVTAQVPNGPKLRFFYQTDPVAENASAERQAELLENWKLLPEYTIKAFEYMNKHFGEYPYDEYIVIQGGDGGMEYIMATLITGNRNLTSLVGVTVHELVHAWYQGVLANDESYYYWMDEGFTSYASARVMDVLFGDGDEPMNLHQGRYNNYFSVVNAGIEEPMTTHADHYLTNRAYGMAAYSKGAIFLHQLTYIIGRETFDRGMLRFFDEWKFKHPTGLDFIRVMEKESGMQLYWYYEYWVQTIKTIDYGINEVAADGNKTVVTLERVGDMPMPLDVEVTYTDGTKEHYYIPMRIMYGQKSNEFAHINRVVSEDWPWVFPTYTLEIHRPVSDIARIEIDPTMRMADVNRTNNVYTPR